MSPSVQSSFLLPTRLLTDRKLLLALRGVGPEPEDYAQKSGKSRAIANKFGIYWYVTVPDELVNDFLVRQPSHFGPRVSLSKGAEKFLAPGSEVRRGE